MTRPVHNLRLLQAADIVSGQFSSLDMIAVDLVSEFQIVHAPDKSSFDSPPVKAAHRYAQGGQNLMTLLMIIFTNAKPHLLTNQIIKKEAL
jgi:hypothetical protein